MAKQRPKPKEPSSPSPGRHQGAGRPTPSPGPAAQPARRTTYIEAVGLYERGLAALQRHDYAEAITLFQSVLTRYPDEKELVERVRLYLNICERQAVRRDAVPQTIEERLYAATLAVNGGRHDEALAHLRLVRDEDPDNDHALYMLAVAHAQRGEHAEAVAHLERSIALNPENRSLARRDPDFDPLADDEAFQAVLESSAGQADPRRSLRSRSGR